MYLVYFGKMHTLLGKSEKLSITVINLELFELLERKKESKKEISYLFFTNMHICTDNFLHQLFIFAFFPVICSRPCWGRRRRSLSNITTHFFFNAFVHLGWSVLAFYLIRQRMESRIDLLCSASARGNLGMVLRLLQAGVDVNGRNKFNKTPLQVGTLCIKLFTFEL